MAINSKHKPSDHEVKGIWADTYKLFLQYKDVDAALLENEINLACESIGDNYENCELAANLIEAVLRVFIGRSATYENLSKDKDHSEIMRRENGKESTK